ncbi:hypothetical protein [Spirosoma harenae]
MGCNSGLRLDNLTRQSPGSGNSDEFLTANEAGEVVVAKIEELTFYLIAMTNRNRQ